MRKLIPLTILALSSGCGAPISSQSGAAACIVATACDLLPRVVLGGTSTTSACTAAVSTINDPQYQLLLNIQYGVGLTKFTPAQINCIAGAGSNCNQAKACLDNGMNPPTACSGASSACMGSFIVSCSPATGTGGNNGQSIFDCSSLGAGYSCIASSGNVDCGTASCGGGGGVPTHCNGTTLQRCNNGILEQVDCSPFNATCVSTSVEAHCRGKGQACQSNDPGGTLGCQGSVLQVCADGQIAFYDCARLGLGCFPNPNGQAGFSCRAGNDCDPGSFTSTCTGNVLSFCNKGKIDTFNCTASGFTGCDAQNGTCTR